VTRRRAKPPADRGRDTSTPSFSRRTGLDRTPHPLASAIAARRCRPGPPPLDLMVTNPTRMALPERADLRRALAAVGGKAADYAPSPMGERWVREAVAADLAALDRRPPTPADRLLLTASTSEAYGILFRVLADPGEAVLVPQPSYPLFDHLLRFAGLVPAPYPLRFDGDRRVVDPAELAQAQARAPAPPRALIAVAPNNPTGSYLSPADVRALASTGLPLIVDEVFRHHPVVLDRPPPRAGELLAGSKSLVCSLGGASKHLALPQLKVAWTEVGGPDGLVRELVERFELVADATLDLAPPMAMVVRHYRMELTDSSAIRDALISWSGSPDSSKSLLPAHAIERFGLMAPVALSSDEIEAVVDYVMTLEPAARGHGMMGGRMKMGV